MSHRHDDADPVEHDPTGVRALLGSLPDPGPMPEHLVARITAALEQESRRPAGSADGATARTGAAAGWDPPPVPRHLAAAAPSSPAGGAGVVPLRRRRAWVLGAAAAAVVALGLGGVVVDRLSPGGLQASLGIAGSGDDAGAAESAAGGSADRPALVAEDGTLGVVVLATGTDYTAGSLAALAGGLPRAPGDGAAAGARGDAPAEALAGPAGARACAAGLGVDPADTVAVDLATFGGRDAAVVVATAADGSSRAWVVERTCTAASPGIVRGPVALR